VLEFKHHGRRTLYYVGRAPALQQQYHPQWQWQWR
jgi:hypothetical protein